MRTNLFGVGIFSKSPNVTRQLRENFYLEVNPDEDKTQVFAYGTPGLEQFVDFGATPSRGVLNFQNRKMFLVHRNKFYSVDAGATKTELGTLNTSSGLVSMAHNGQLGHQVVIVDGTNGYVYDTNSGAFAQITSNFTDGATTVCFMSGWFFIDIPALGQFQKSAAYDGTTWAAADVATAEYKPDEMMAVYAMQQQLLLFGTQSIEFWAPIPSITFPLARVPGTALDIGLAAKFSIAMLDNTPCFLSTTDKGEAQVMLLNGYQWETISTNALENTINNYQTVSDATAFSYSDDGHYFYQINFPSGGESWLYDRTTSLLMGQPVWSKRSSYQTGVHRGNMHTFFAGDNYVADGLTGILYKQKHELFDDNGDPIIGRIRSKKFFGKDNENISFGELTVDIEAGVGLPTGQGSDPIWMLRVSKDGGHTWGYERQASAGKMGNYKERLIYRRLGRGREWIFDLSISDPVKRVVTGAWLR